MYSERYRPQFHFSPKSGWIGDPDGTIKYNDQYHLFWWGHAISKDLVYWKEQPYPMTGDNNSFTYYSGSVVVDKANTGGFGTSKDTAMVAIYTMHDKNTNNESQGISYSTDFTNFHYYSGNPVIPSSSSDFRDPQVFWDNQTNRWVMVIVRPLSRSIEFYCSDNLKNWEYKSSFSGIGAQKEVWEVPDLFEMPVNGNVNNKKWVLMCNMGPNKAQYWVGDFDGKVFKVDSLTSTFFDSGNGVDGVVFEDFESEDYGKWTTVGTAFGNKPSVKKITGSIGQGLANSGTNGDVAIGKLISSEFTIEKKFINFLLYGGMKAENTSLQIFIDDMMVTSLSGTELAQMVWAGIDVSAWVGKKAHIEIVDLSTEYWGRIAVDQIMFSDILNNTNLEHANWIDFGPDFYAVRSFRDYDHAKNRTIWMAWMGNWQYANKIPTLWGGSTAESIPREIELISTDKGYKIRQKAIPELEKLRLTEISFSNRNIENTYALNEFKPKKNTYEFEATYQIIQGSNQKVGFNLCVNGINKLILGYDEKTSNVFLDRRYCGNVSFHPAFPKKVEAPIQVKNNEIKFHVFVDQLSIEVFINDGELVLTSLIFPDWNETGIVFFSENSSAVLKNFKAWELRSIWDNNLNTSSSLNIQNDNLINIYPNPATTELIIHNDSNIPQKLIINIFNQLGERLISESQNVNYSEYSINISRLKTGLYHLSIQQGKEFIQKTFLKL